MDLGRLLLGLFYENWIYLVIGAAVILVILGGVSVVWYVYCSDNSKARRYKIKVSPTRPHSSSALGIPPRSTEVEVTEVEVIQGSSDADILTVNTSQLPPPVPELLRSMRRERQRLSEPEITTGLPSSSNKYVTPQPDNILVDDGAILIQESSTSARSTTLDRIRTRSQLNKQISSTVVTSSRSNTMTSQSVMTSRDSSRSSEGSEQGGVKKKGITARLSAPWQQNVGENTPTVPFRSCDSFVYQQTAKAYRQAYRDKERLEEEDSIGDTTGNVSMPPRNVITKPRDVIIKPRDVTQPPSRDIIKPQRSLSSSGIVSDQPTPLTRSKTHGAIKHQRPLPRDVTPRGDVISSRDVTSRGDVISSRDVIASRSTNKRVSRDDNRFSTQLSADDLSPKLANSHMFAALPEIGTSSEEITSRGTFTTQRGGSLSQHDQEASEEMRVYENNRDTFRKNETKDPDMDRYADGFSLPRSPDSGPASNNIPRSPKYTAVNKIRNNSVAVSSSRDVIAPRDLTHSHKHRSNTLQAPWAHQQGQSVGYSRENNLDHSVGDHMNYTCDAEMHYVNSIHQQYGGGAAGGTEQNGACSSLERYQYGFDMELEEFSDSESEDEFMEPVIYANQETGFYTGHL